jgi:hypothetical protein
VAKAEQTKLEKCIVDLDNDAQPVRDEAMKELQSQAHEFAPLLRAKFKEAGPGEVRNRLIFVLDQTNPESQPVQLLVKLRVLNLLEQMGTKEARGLLRSLADGAPLARVTVEARAALERVEGKPK